MLQDRTLKRIQTILLGFVFDTVRPIAGSLLVAGALFCLGLMSVQAQNLSLSDSDMKYDAKGASIAADGDASDWAGLEWKSRVPFEKGGELVLFEEYAGGTWSGVEDHSSAVAFAWDADNLYIGVVVTDDTHQNGGAAPA